MVFIPNSGLMPNILILSSTCMCSRSETLLENHFAQEMPNILRSTHLPNTPWPLHESFCDGHASFTNRWSCCTQIDLSITRRWCSITMFMIILNLEVHYAAILMVQIKDVIFSNVAITSPGTGFQDACNHWKMPLIFTGHSTVIVPTIPKLWSMLIIIPIAHVVLTKVEAFAVMGEFMK